MLGLTLVCRVLEAQDDPARFLFVKKWVGTFTRSFVNSGTGTESSCWSAQWDYSHSADITAQLLFDTDASHCHLHVWESRTSASEHVQLSERIFETSCEDGSTLEQTATVNSENLQEGFTVVVNLYDNTYEVRFGVINAEVTTKLVTPGGTATGAGPRQVTWFTNVTLSLPATGLTLSGSVRAPLRDNPLLFLCVATHLSDEPLSSLDSDLVVTWNIVPAEVEELEVEVDPVGYDEWLPEGADFGTQEGTNILIRATLQSKDGQATQHHAEEFKFELVKVSQEPGICLNYPPAAFATDTPDLRFATNRNPNLEVSGDGLTARTVENFEFLTDPDHAKATVSSYDFGAYGSLRVTATVCGREIVGYLKGDPSKSQKDILLPKRKPDSLIADAWKKANGVEDLDDADDSDAEPPGDGHSGDGLALYEEYRGFFENGEHVRTDPKHKDLFILDTIQTHNSLAGILNFAWQSGLKVHYELNPTEIDVDDRLINFNRSLDAPNVTNQHGLILVRGELDKGVSGQAESAPGYMHSTPGSKVRIVLNSNSDYFNPGDPLSDREPIDLITRPSTTVSHELAHGCSVWHHGVGDNYCRCIDLVTWTVITNPDGTHGLSEKGRSITVLNENGSPVAIAEIIARLRHTDGKVWLGLDHGQHSGVESCFMRYDGADAYISRTNSSIRYWIRETRGFDLCTSRLGTGVNDMSRDRPQPRYGDAYVSPDGKLSGNCKAQICVNDTQIDSDKHKRQ